MIKYNNKTIKKLEYNASEVNKMYYDGDIAYGVDGGSQPTPTGSTCYEVISTPITSYTSTTYNSVYSFADTKWYMLNNLNHYEEYGIYETGTSLSDFTYYPNKLVVIGETEYQYQSNGWVEVGEYIDVQTTYEVTNDSTALQGKELSTTFKIPYADVEALGGWFNLYIGTADGENLDISNYDYRYNGSTTYQGTVTDDGEYYYFTLPSEAPSSIIIQETDYWNSTPIHLIFSSRQVSVEYAEKEMPTAKVYNTVASLQAVGCPTVGVGQYGVVGDDVYQFEESEEWVNKAKKFVAKYNDDNANAIVCNASNELSSVDTQPSYFSKNAMTDAYIGNCVTSIGESAFNGCSGLTSVTIPDSVTSIGDYAFQSCSGLTSVTIPDSVTSIGIGAFRYCSGLTGVTVNATTPPTLGTNVFTNTYNCPIYVPCESVSAYKSAWSIYATRIQGIPPCGEPPTPSFNGKWLATYTGGTTSSAECNTSSVITSGEVTKTDLVSLEIGSCVTSIGSSAFTSAATLSSVTILDGLTNISTRLFQGCNSLTSVTIPDSVTSIGIGAFFNCKSLASITIPDGVRSIGQAAFLGCGLTSITIPNSVTSISNSVFGGCTSLTSVSIGSGVTSINSSVFTGCYSLSSITIPNSVRSIGSNAFSSCSGLTNITIPDSVTGISESAFNGCSGLTSVTIGNGVTIIGRYAFRNCRRLTSITINTTTPPTLTTTDAFEGTNNCPIYVPAASVNAYKTATNGWSTYASRIQAIP